MTHVPGGGMSARALRSTIFVLMFMAALGSFTIDLYLPALPEMQAALRTSVPAIQLTLTATTVGLALGQLVVGNWSDSAGRRTPLLIATTLHVLASVGVTLAPTIGWVLGCRFGQGVGAAGSAVVATAMVRDLFVGVKYVETAARLSLVSGLMPVAAPVLGGFLTDILDWRGLFTIIAAYGAVVFLLATLLLGETLPPERRQSMRPRSIASRYRELLGDRAFVGVALVAGLTVSGVFAVMTTSSFLLQQTYGMSGRQYGLLFALNAVSFVVGTQAAAWVVRRRTPGAPLKVAIPTLALSGFAMIPAGQAGIIGIQLVTMIFMVAAGLTGPCLGAIALRDHGHHAGTAAAVLGLANYGMAGLASPLVGLVGVGSVTPTGLLLGTLSTIAAALWWTLIRQPAQRHTAATV